MTNHAMLLVDDCRTPSEQGSASVDHMRALEDLTRACLCLGDAQSAQRYVQTLLALARSQLRADWTIPRTTVVADSLKAMAACDWLMAGGRGGASVRQRLKERMALCESCNGEWALLMRALMDLDSKYSS